MCGIIGIVGNTTLENELHHYLDHLINRGPDNQQVLNVSSECVMGSTRLAMVDRLPRSNQPFVDEISGDVLTFNGEIYNFREIRQELISIGLSFITESDTEVLMKFLQTYEVPDLSKLNGMYAFAFFNRFTNTLTLGRDGLAKKPLYFSRDSERIIWSSSPHIISKIIGKASLNLIRSGTYRYLGYQIAPQTSHPDICELEPGTIEKFEITSLSQVEKRQIHLTKVTKFESIRSALRNAVEKRIDHQSEIALSLSGGLDSTVLAILVKELGIACTSFSATWTDSDKLRYNFDGLLGREISKKLGFQHVDVEMLKTNELESEIKRFLLAMEEPNSNPTGVSMMKLYEAISKQKIRMVLTGDGADEIFSGYERYNLIAKRKNFLQLSHPNLERYILSTRNRYSKFPIALIASQIDPKSICSWLYWHSIFTPSEWSEIQNKKLDIQKEIVILEDNLKKICHLDKKTNPIDIMMQRDSDIWLSMESNKKLDRVSMFFSIEARSPFQDNEVISIANMKMQESSFQKLNKKMLRDEFPEVDSLGISSKKMGFISPVGHWLRMNPELLDSTFSVLANTGDFRMPKVKTLAARALEGDFRKISQIWNLVILAQWIKLQNE